MNRRDFFLTQIKLAVGLGLFSQSRAFATTAESLAKTHAKKISSLHELIKITKEANLKTLTVSGIDPTVDFFVKSEGDYGAPNPGLVFFNDRFDYVIVDLPLFPHSVEQNPTDPSKIMLIPRRLNNCIEFDIVQNKITNEIILPKNKFYGHGCYVAGTDLFYATSILSEKLLESSLVLFDLKTKQLVNEVHLENAYGAHQCSLSRDGKNIIVTTPIETKRAKPSFLWIDVKTGKITKTVTGVQKRADHFSELEDGYIIFTGGEKNNNATPTVLGAISPDDIPHNFKIEGDLTHFYNQSVSILGFIDKNISIMTNATQNSVYVMDYKKGTLVKRLNIPTPRGLSLTEDNKKLLITSLHSRDNKSASIFEVDLETLLVTNVFLFDKARVHSSHATRIII